MALFKISKGLAANLAKNVPNAKEGFAYFTSDDGKFYIDTAGDGTTATPAVVGTNRIPLNAYASDVLKAGEMSTTDGVVYPILAFKITDTAKNLVEAKYGKIGFKNGTLVIPSLEDHDEMYITNEGDGRALVIEKLRGPTGNNGPGPGIQIISTEASTYAIEVTGNSKGIKVTQDPTDDLELTPKQYVDTSVANKQDKITADGILKGDGEGNITAADNIEVSLVSIDKSTVGLGNVDNTSDLNKPISSATQTALNNKADKSALNNYLPLAGGIMTGNIAMSSKKITGLATPSADADAANKAYVDKIISANDAMVFKGVISSDTELPITHENGWTYRVNKAGTYVGNKCEIGDLIICIKDSTSTTQNNSDWTVVQTNIDGAVVGPVNAEDNHVAVFDGATGKIIKDSGISLNDKQNKITVEGILKGDGNGGISAAVKEIDYAGADRFGFIPYSIGAEKYFINNAYTDLCFIDKDTTDITSTLTNGIYYRLATEGPYRSQDNNGTTSGTLRLLDFMGGDIIFSSSALNEDGAWMNDARIGSSAGSFIVVGSDDASGEKTAISCVIQNNLGGFLELSANKTDDGDVSTIFNIEVDSITGVPVPTEDFGAANKKYVDQAIDSALTDGALNLQKGNAIDITEEGSNITIGVEDGVFANASHNHDDRYYTENEVDTKLNDYVLKTVFDATSDLNDIKTSGFYRVQTNANSPNSYGQLIVSRGNDTYMQLYGDWTDGSIYARAWGDGSSKVDTWHRLTRDDDTGVYVKKTGDTMTGRLIINKAGEGVRIVNGDTPYMEFSRDSNGSQIYGLWDNIKANWMICSNGSVATYNGKMNADITGTSWRGPVDNYQTAAIYSNFETKTTSQHQPFYTVRLSDATFTLGSETQNRQFGLFMFKNSNTTNSPDARFYMEPTGVVRCSTQLYGAVWNDYAEYRESNTIEAGKCVVEAGDDTLKLSSERMQPGANITSDTFGFAIGETDKCKTPIAVSGRVLAYGYEDREEFRKNIGRPVCSGPNGTVSIMTDEEYKEKGYCAIGTISAVPDYEEWGTGNVKVDGRIWIKVI